MPAFEDGYQDRPIAEDLIDWQYQAQNESLIRLGDMACGELNQFAAGLDEVNRLLAGPPCDVEAVSAAVVEAMRLGTLFAVHVLGMVYRNPEGLSFVSVTSPSVN